MEVWQPILALAQMVENDGATGLLTLLRNHAQVCIRASNDESMPDADETLLRILADAVRDSTQHLLTPTDLMKRAQEDDLVTFKRYSAKGIANILKRYRIKSTHGRQRTYSHVDRRKLMQIEQAYGIDLGLASQQASQASLSIDDASEEATGPTQHGAFLPLTTDTTDNQGCQGEPYEL